jgi:hypothetical protein
MWSMTAAMKTAAPGERSPQDGGRGEGEKRGAAILSAELTRSA